MHDIGELLLAWMHVLAATLWVGGLILMNWILKPALRAKLPAEASSILQVVSRRFDPVAGIALLTIAGTGVLRAWHRGTMDPQVLFFTQYGTLLLAKMSLVIVMAFLIAVGILRQKARDRVWSLITFTSVASILLAVTLRVG